MNLWDQWKKGFAAWESTTAAYMEQVMANPAVLGPAGQMLTLAMKTKAATDKATAAWWAAMGLPTRRDQERSLHKLNQLESRLADLEEQLAAARAQYLREGVSTNPGGGRRCRPRRAPPPAAGDVDGAPTRYARLPTRAGVPRRSYSA